MRGNGRQTDIKLRHSSSFRNMLELLYSVPPGGFHSSSCKIPRWPAKRVVANGRLQALVSLVHADKRLRFMQGARNQSMLPSLPNLSEQRQGLAHWYDNCLAICLLSHARAHH